MIYYLADTTTSVGWDSISSIMSALTDQISVTSIVGVVAGAIGASIGIAFLWWVARKGVSALMGAFRKGKVSV